MPTTQGCPSIIATTNARFAIGTVNG